MKTVEDDVNLSNNDFYDSIIVDYEAMQTFIAKYGDIELVKLYRYVLDKAKALSQDKENNGDMISYCWLASMELEQTDAIRRYLNREITQEDIDAYEVKKAQEIQEIVDLLEKRKKEKKSMIKQISKMFRGK